MAEPLCGIIVEGFAAGNCGSLTGVSHFDSPFGGEPWWSVDGGEVECALVSGGIEEVLQSSSGDVWMVIYVIAEGMGGLQTKDDGCEIWVMVLGLL